MRTADEMMKLILDTSKKMPEVKAVAMNGSRSNQNAAKDIFQDYDIVYFVADEAIHTLIKNVDWLTIFGKRVISQTPANSVLFPNKTDGRYTFLMLFEDDNRIDLMLCPLSQIAAWRSDDPIGRILYDPDNLLPRDLLQNDQIYWVKRPDQRQFNDCCNEFWWISTYVVKGIYRNEPAYAADHFYNYCYQELLRLASWIAAEKKDYRISVGKNHKYLFNYLEPNFSQEITGLLDLRSLAALARGLLHMQKLFHQSAQHFAVTARVSYNFAEAQNVMNYTKKWLR